MVGQTGKNFKSPMRINSTRFVLLLAAMSSLLTLTTCQDGPTPLTAEAPLHLEDHLDAAVITGSQVPSDVPKPVEWHFGESQPDWKVVRPLQQHIRPAEITRTKDSLRISLDQTNDYRDFRGTFLGGGIYIELSDWRREEWGEILVRARTSDKISAVGVGFNLRKELSADLWAKWPFLHGSDRIPVIRDGTEQTYVFRADSHFMGDLWEGPWRQFGVEFWAREPASVDILSVSIIPKEARYASAAVGLRTEVRDEAYRRTLFTHTPAKLEYRVQVPPAGRLDVGLGVLRENEPITFRVAARPDGQEAEYLLDESYADADHWAQRSLDLAQFAGRTVTLSLETEAESVGTVALWAAPTLSGKRATEKPNIVFYIIDGAGADYMSAYGYNRRTTPNIERLAAEGALFEHAYSNSSWTRPSTLSFLTGLQHSALGGMQNGRNAPPPEVPTISEHLHQAGYQTALFTSNANAANMSGLDRGVDVLREKEAELSESTIELHADFWMRALANSVPRRTVLGTLPNYGRTRATSTTLSVCRSLREPGTPEDNPGLASPIEGRGGLPCRSLEQRLRQGGC